MRGVVGRGEAGVVSRRVGCGLSRRCGESAAGEGWEGVLGDRIAVVFDVMGRKDGSGSRLCVREGAAKRLTRPDGLSSCSPWP